MANKKITHIIIGIVAGLIAYSIIGKLGLYFLQISWEDYALHARDKSFTIVMLLARLLIGILAAISAGVTVVKIARDRRSVWFVGVVVWCVASYIHVFRVWGDYPIWYHVAYLLPIIPVVGLSHRIFFRGRRV